MQKKAQVAFGSCWPVACLLEHVLGVCKGQVAAQQRMQLLAFDPGWLIRRSVSGTAGVIGTRMPRKDTLGAGMSLTSPQDCTAAAVWQADLCQGLVAFFGFQAARPHVTCLS